MSKTAVVCGGSRGLGLALARRFVEKGYKVAFCARTETDVDAATGELAAMSGAVAVLGQTCDLRSRDETERFLANVEARLGPIDVLVANAATLTVGPLEALDVRDFEEAMDSVWRTSLHAAMAVVPSMRARRSGTIAFITSIGGKIAVPHLAPYSTAKFAEVGLAHALHAELAKDGVGVLTVVPGLMRTGSPAHVVFKGDAEKEYAWFAASANAPVISIDADRAAARIVSAIERGKSELTFTPEARLVARTHDLLPSVVLAALGLVARLLPRAGSRREVRRGADVERTARSPALAAVRDRDRRFARRHGQLRAG